MKVGDKVKVIKKSTSSFCLKHDCCKIYVGKTGTIKAMWEGKVSVDKFENKSSWCDQFTKDCLQPVTELNTVLEQAIAILNGETP